MKHTTTTDRIDFYDNDKAYHYEDFWSGRDYEHMSEIKAIRRLVGKRTYPIIMDVGGGYGRLAPILLQHGSKVIVLDPSKRQLRDGEKKFGKDKRIEFLLMDQKDVIPTKDNSLDLVTMIRVSHHLIDPIPMFAEIHRILKPGGRAIIEIANYDHFVHRVKSMAKFKKLPTEPVQVGSVANGKEENTPFVNHNPKTITSQLRSQDLAIVKSLSVSNLRSRKFKQVIPMKVMLQFESAMQGPLAPMYFGPSIFFLVEKKK